VRAAILEYLETLRARITDVAWTRPENLHVTLKFLGAVARARLTRLAERLDALASAQRRFTIEYAGVDAFPSAARPRVLWIGARAPELATLAVAVDVVSVETCAIEPERRAYHPHLTLGRVRERGGSARRHPAASGALTADRTRAFGAATASALILFRSDTGPAGARHLALARAALRA